MGSPVKRRDFLMFLGGGVVGAVVSPLPWKLLDDAAIWTQNWPWIAKPPRGKIQTKYTHCTLCPAGCGLRVRCVGNQPIALSGVPGHPLGQGALCPLGLAGHHLPYHPARLTTPERRSGEQGTPGAVPISLDEAVALIAAWIADAKGAGGDAAIAILDGRPDRTLSLLYRRFLASLGRGAYLTPPREGAAEAILEGMLRERYGPLGLDLEQAKTILSFGAPIMDGWGTPGRMARLSCLPSERRPMLIQVETRPSRTALHADRWLRIKPGTEVAFALGLAHVIIEERLCDERDIRRKASDFDAANGLSYRSLVAQFTPDRVGNITGLPPKEIREVARRFARSGPSIAIPGVDPGGGPLGPEEERAIWGLNLLVGNVGRAGGYLPRRPLPKPRGMEEPAAAVPQDVRRIPDGSIRLLIVDGSGSGCALPPAVLERKLAPRGARVVSLSPFREGPALRADLVLPAPAPMEAFEEVPTPFDAPVASFGLSVPLLPPPPGTIEPGELIRRLVTAIGIVEPFGESVSSFAELLQRRVEAIHATGRGSVFESLTGRTVPMTDILLPEGLWKLLARGGCWVDDRAPARQLPRFSFLSGRPDGDRRLLGIGEAGRLKATEPRSGDQGAGEAHPLVLMPFGSRHAVGDGPLPPVMAKLYRESDLRAPAGHCLINPGTGRELGLHNGARAALETRFGPLVVEVRFNAAVMPGVVHVAAGPASWSFGDLEPRPGEDVLKACHPGADGTWRLTSAKVREA